MVSPCGHTFCETCIYQALETTPQCPIDCSPLTIQLLEPAVKIIVNMVNELNVYCPRSERGCDFIGQRQYMDQHLNNDCLYAYQPCQLEECQELVLKKDLNSHISTCKHRETECKMCKKIMPAFEFEDHYKLCPSEVIPCPHCDSSRSRSEHALHISNCPKAPITCSHEEFGCPWKGAREDADQHKKTCPYEAMSGFLHYHQQQHKSMKEEFQSIRKEHESLKRNQQDLRQQVENMTNQLGILFPAHFALDPDLPLDAQQEVVLSETQRLQSDIDNLNANMASMELKQNMALMTETFRLQEELQSIRAVCHGMRMQMHYLLMERRGAMMAAPPPHPSHPSSVGNPPPPHDHENNESAFQRMRQWIDAASSRQDTKL
ncbi:unnamed protein product [Cunninghamella echinulata]